MFSVPPDCTDALAIRWRLDNPDDRQGPEGRNGFQVSSPSSIYPEQRDDKDLE